MFPILLSRRFAMQVTRCSPERTNGVRFQRLRRPCEGRELDAVLVSLNGDFADIVIYPPSSYRGIIAFQVKNHPEVIPAL